MQVLIDTNVILDVLLNRPQFVQDATEILRLSGNKIEAYVSATDITDIYFIAQKEIRDKEQVRNLLKRLIKVVHVAGISEQDIINALNAAWIDFEDSVQNAIAESHNFEAIITRNPADFKKSSLAIYSPKDFLEQFGNRQAKNKISL